MAIAGVGVRYDLRFLIPDDPEGEVQGFTIARDTNGVPLADQASTVPAQPASDAPIVDVETIYDSTVGGICWSKRLVEDTVAYGNPAWLRSWRGIGPPPKLEWLNLPVQGAFVDNGAFVSAETGDPDFVTSLYILFGQYILKHAGCQGASLTVAYDGGSPTFTSWAGGYGGPTWIGRTGHEMVRLQGTFSVSPSKTTPHVGLTNLTVGKSFGAGSGAQGLPHDVFLAAETDLAQFKWTMGDPIDALSYHPGTPVYTGSPAPMRKFITAPQAFAIVKRDGVWMHDGTRPLYLTPWWGNDEDYDAGWAALFYGPFVVCAHPRYLALVPWTKEFQNHPWMAQPGAPPIANRTPINGAIYALANVHGWLYAAVYNKDEDQTYICAGLLRDQLGVEGIGPIVWYGAEQVIPGRVTMMKPVRVQTGAVAGRTFQGPPWLYIGTFVEDESGTGETVRRFLGTHDANRWYLCRYRLASGGGDIYDDPSITEYEEHWRVIYPRDDFGRQHAATNKMVRAYSAAVEGAVDGASGVNVYAATDDGAMTFQGTALPPGDDFLANEMLTGRGVTIEARGRGTPGTPTLLSALRAHATLIPETVDRQSYLLDLGPAAEGEDSPHSFGSTQSAYEYLRRLERTGAVSMWDGTGEWLVKVLPGIRRVPVSKPTGDGGYRLYARVTIDFIEGEFEYDDGGSLDGGTW